MKEIKFLSLVLILGISQLSCYVFTPKPTKTSVPTTAAPTITPTETTPAEVPTDTPTLTPTEMTQSAQAAQKTPSGAPSDNCIINVIEGTSVYMRPSKESLVFGMLPSGIVANVHGRTEDGWIGFDPGVMQAGNAGVFRLRWIPPDAEMEFTGDCENLPILWGPPPKVCFIMMMTDAYIYQNPDEDSPIITTVAYGDSAKAIGRFGDNWVKLDLSVGNIGLEEEGWGNMYYMAYNGDCSDLPEIDH